jgi:hypothetical protein
MKLILNDPVAIELNGSTRLSLSCDILGSDNDIALSFKH